MWQIWGIAFVSISLLTMLMDPLGALRHLFTGMPWWWYVFFALPVLTAGAIRLWNHGKRNDWW